MQDSWHKKLCNIDKNIYNSFKAFMPIVLCKNYPCAKSQYVKYIKK